MRVALLHVEMHLPYSQSLKDKRMVLRRVKDRLQKFNVAVAEVEIRTSGSVPRSASSPSRPPSITWSRHWPPVQTKSTGSNRGW
ncbi:MAG TPA: DUF503 family protein [Vicinamibacterales bacterium]|nr:DUF503 family protein [Vicinamibacterales bacterium]